MLPVLWVFASAVWIEGRADSPSELVRARRRLQHASAWAQVDGWLEYQLATARTDDPPFDPFPREYVDERFDGPGRRGQVGSYAAFLVQIFLASGKLAAARAELDDIRRSLPRRCACVSVPRPVRPSKPSACTDISLTRARVLHDEFERRSRDGSALDADEAVALALTRQVSGRAEGRFVGAERHRCNRAGARLHALGASGPRCVDHHR